MTRIMKFKFFNFEEKNIGESIRIAILIYRFIFPEISLFYKMETRVECGKNSEDYDIIHFKTHITIFEGNFI